MRSLNLLFLGLFALAATASPTPIDNPLSGTLEKRATRTANPGGCLEVQGTSPSSSQYSTISLAVAALGSTTTTKCIFIWPGTYNERVTVKYGGALNIYGYTTATGYHSDNTVTITTDITSSAAGTLDASAALHLYGNNYSVYNINVQNTYGAGAQAVALCAAGNYLGLYAVGIYGYQDTLYAKSGYQYYSKCFIQGADDFIFGDAAAWFGDCTISVNGGGSITANNRASATDTAWYVFDSSNILAADGYTTTGSVYLGRPWGLFSRVMYQRCTLSNIINAQGWTTMTSGATPTYEEYDNTGAGASTTSRLYETTATALVTYSQLWDGNTSWKVASF